jgi:selT/selW/selH-like putative selenoprotein
LAVEVELVAGSGGVFTVYRDGEPVFAKSREKRFPENEEIIERLTRVLS